MLTFSHIFLKIDIFEIEKTVFFLFSLKTNFSFFAITFNTKLGTKKLGKKLKKMRNLLKNKENAFISRACTVNCNETLRTFTKQLEEKGAQGQKITQK